MQLWQIWHVLSLLCKSQLPYVRLQARCTHQAHLTTWTQVRLVISEISLWLLPFHCSSTPFIFMYWHAIYNTLFLNLKLFYVGHMKLQACREMQTKNNTAFPAIMHTTVKVYEVVNIVRKPSLLDVFSSVTDLGLPWPPFIIISPDNVVVPTVDQSWAGVMVFRVLKDTLRIYHLP